MSGCALLLAACGQKEAIRYDGKTVTAKGWTGDDANWASVLKVYASTAADAPPLAGSYERHGDRIVFKPSFPPSPSVTLRAVFRQADGGLESAVFPAKEGRAVAASTQVQAIYPTAGSWPANTLKFYIQFSAPMSQGQAWTHIHLLDDKGQPIPQPFVKMDQELWNSAGDRLTVLLDSGGIKRGLTNHETARPPLIPGRKYTLKIDADWKDVAGAPLIDGYENLIIAGPDIRVPVEPREWKLNPVHSVDQALYVQFPRPMDSTLAKSAITVRKDGVPVSGKIVLADMETLWIFVPDRRWSPGAYQLHVEGILEDIAGNRVRRPFDADTSDKAQAGPPPAPVDIPFKVS